jgi:hypothetical protein
LDIPKDPVFLFPKLAKFFSSADPPVNFFPTLTRQYVTPALFFTLRRETLGGKIGNRRFFESHSAHEKIKNVTRVPN